MAIANQPAIQSNAVAVFDDLGLLVHDCDQSDPAEEVIFKLLQMKALLATAFELNGFTRGVAISPEAQNLAVEFSLGRHGDDGPCRNRHYVGFKTA